MDLILQNAKAIYGHASASPQSIWIQDGRIRSLAPFSTLEKTIGPDRIKKIPCIDSSRWIVLPGFVDSHTHMLFQGSREEEFYMRAAGRSYLDILKNGGGIHSTVRAVRAASEEELLQRGLSFLDKALAFGITTIEIKSGYGLDPENEAKMFRVMEKMQSMHPVDIVPTFLVHTAPLEWDRDRYLSHVAGHMIPEFRRYSDWFDIFVEKGVFDLKESEILLRKAADAGYHTGMHVNQVHDIGGVRLAVEMGVRHISHLEWLIEEDAKRIIETETLFPVFLPAAEAFVFSERIGQIHRLMQIPDRIVLSTDFNPGSSPVLSPILVMVMAVLRYRITDHSLLLDAFTKNPARMLCLEDRGEIKPGLKADLLCMELDRFEQIPYIGTIPAIARVIKNGEVV